MGRIGWTWRGALALEALCWSFSWLSPTREPAIHLVGEFPGSGVYLYTVEGFWVLTPMLTADRRPPSDDFSLPEKWPLADVVFAFSLNMDTLPYKGISNRKDRAVRWERVRNRPGACGFRLGTWGGLWAVVLAPWLVAALGGVAALPLVVGGYKAWMRRRRMASGRCAKCGYILFGLPAPRCPECGTTFSDAGGAPAARRVQV
jgi:hypothetical protein